MPIPDFPDEFDTSHKAPRSRRTKITIGVIAVLVALMVLAHLTGIAPH